MIPCYVIAVIKNSKKVDNKTHKYKIMKQNMYSTNFNFLSLAIRQQQKINLIIIINFMQIKLNFFRFQFSLKFIFLKI